MGHTSTTIRNETVMAFSIFSFSTPPPHFNSNKRGGGTQAVALKRWHSSGVPICSRSETCTYCLALSLSCG